MLPILLQSWSRSKPSAPSRTPMPFLSQCSLDPTCDILLSPLCSLSNHSLFVLPSSLLPLDILVFARLVPSLEVLTPPAGLFPLDSCAPAPVAFRLWLPSSCPGSRIANPFFFKYIPHDLHARVQALLVLGSLVPLHHIHHVAHSNSSTLDPAPPVASIHVAFE